MATPVQTAVSAAFKLFSRQNYRTITIDSLKEIITNFNQVSKAELQINPSLLVDKIPGPDDPPVTYIRILENKLVTVAMFVIQQGNRLPLHDHPEMFGFLKVVHGSVKIKTYTPVDIPQQQMPKSVNEYLDQKFGAPRLPVYPCRYEGTRLVTEKDECCVLTPAGCNIHEIVSDSGTAAFIDILSPSYDHSHTEDRRPCSYYKELNVDVKDSAMVDLKYLIRIRPPNDYWCDESPYCGPEVSSYASNI